MGHEVCRRRRLLITAVIALASVGCGVAAVHAQGFKPDCPLPFDSLAAKHPIDDDCGPEGTGTGEAQQAQNRAKNNFCATGTPVRITYATFQRLQHAAEQQGISFGSNSKIPPDRSVLKDLYTTSDGAKLGEGALVRLAAYVLDAHYSNVRNGETVNCKQPGEENNDIHVSLGKSASEHDLCNSVTAEVSPHYRPPSWTPANLTQLAGHPVRITGQLFFDASHKPCANGQGSPRRVAIWEIHPVYAIDVCRNGSLGGCDVNDDRKWVPLEEWLNLEQENE